MDESLVISAANLDVIEKSLGNVATELSGVINNVNSVNNQINTVDNKVESLNSEIKNLMNEMRETVIITNARQSIMFNNEQIDKKFGYFDEVRRNCESLIDAVLNSNVSVDSILNLKEQLLLKNPNYWLSNALSSIISWILDDKENADLEMMNALKKNEEKASLFFCLVNLKFERINTSINWLNKYLSLQDATSLDKDFVTILDLVSTGTFGNNAKQIVLDKITSWFNRLNGEKNIKEKQKELWTKYIEDHENKDIFLPTLKEFSSDEETVRNNLILGSSYYNVYNNFNDTLNENNGNKNIDNILNNLIYEYEEKEQTFQRDNLLNQLIIECNGDKVKAKELFDKEEESVSNRQDLLTLLSNIVIYSKNYKVSQNTVKIALSFMKNYILETYKEKEKKFIDTKIRIKIDEFETNTKDGSNKKEIEKELDIFANNKYTAKDMDLIIMLAVINVLAIIGASFTIENQMLFILIIIITLLADIMLVYNFVKRSTELKISKNKFKENINFSLDRTLAEAVEVDKQYKLNEEDKEKLYTLLNNLDEKSFIKSNGERNIMVGDNNE